MSKVLELAKIKFNKETKEESLVPLSLYKADVLCLYRDRKGVFVITRQGIMHKVPYEITALRLELDL
jgi:hypothetical protein